MQRQGTYKCPKCGSADSYEGTTLVNAGGIGVAREIGDSGAYVGVSGSSTRERTVRKCRSCGEILGKKDYVPTASEREEARTSAQSTTPLVGSSFLYAPSSAVMSVVNTMEMLAGWLKGFHLERCSLELLAVGFSVGYWWPF